MANQSAIDYMDSLGPRKGFKAEPYICVDSDTLTLYFENAPSYAERVDSELTVFKTFDSGELVGFELKGILPKLKELGRLIFVSAKTQKVHVKLLLMIYLAEVKENRESYQEITEKSAETDASILVPA